ncbi:hypothetical protein Ate02nite_57320 [Paractinoplanes tereljensis]|uniref:Uncharacterized protein n=1 Tax=Paractinoplanes tereljensis TaxID=571912 RepID=A0A919TWL3_9ACTN|nr:hypothetical protein Ate02nite_57320 [Actinoplanes tereljensis]
MHLSERIEQLPGRGPVVAEHVWGSGIPDGRRHGPFLSIPGGAIIDDHVDLGDPLLNRPQVNPYRWDVSPAWKDLSKTY